LVRTKGMRLRSLDAAICALIVIIGGLLIADYRGSLNREFAIPTEAIQPENGLQYRVQNVLGYGPHPFLAKLLYPAAGDSPDNPRASTLLLLEDGRLLGFPHAGHDDITSHGGGLYSHWLDTLRFSTSDNSDPRVSRRVYSVVQTPDALRLFVPPLLLLVSLLILRQLRAPAGDLRNQTIRVLVVIIGGLLLADYTGFLNREFTIPTEAIQPENDPQYRVPGVANYAPQSFLSQFFYSSTGDSPGAPRASTLLLLEDGRLLGFPHADHQDISDHGGGRYSHWRDTLFFSASDSSDPRVNRRVYSVVQSPNALRLFVPLLLLIPLLILRQLREPRFFQRVLRSRPFWYGITIYFNICIVVWYVFLSPNIPIVAPDTFAYWRGLDTIPIGYPAFLWCIYALFDSLKAVVVVQITLFSISVLAVQTGVERVSGSTPAGGITAILIAVLGAAASMALWILSESLFVSILLFHVAAAACAFARPTRLNLGLLALTAVLAVSVRPAGYFLFGGIVFLCVFWSGRRRVALRGALIPLIVLASLYYSIGYVVRGVPDQTNAFANLFPHVVPLVDADSPGVSADIHPLLKDPAIAEYRAERQQNQGDWRALQRLEQQNFNRILAGADAAIPFALLGPIAKQAILNHPFGYVDIVLQNMYVWISELTFANDPHIGDSLLSDYENYRGDIIRFYSQELKRPLDFDLWELRTIVAKTEGSAPFVSVSRPYRWPLRGVFLLTAVICGALFMVGRAEPLTAFVAYISALAFGGALAVSLSTVFIPRYAIPLDPLIIIVAALGVWLTLTALLGPGKAVFAAFGRRLANAEAGPSA